jgi:iron complex outermembrane recepter protein
MLRSRLSYLTLAALVIIGQVARGQDSASARLAPVRVEVARDAARSTLELPFAVARLDADSARGGVKRTALTELVFGVPGVIVFNRHNPTQDPRVAIRGFGARSAFGIRGVRVLRDGVPLTVADGQTAVDFLDLETVGSVEVMRGSAGALYGNSSGGVLEFRSALLDTGYTGSVRVLGYDDALRASASALGAAGPVAWRGTYSRTTQEGPREYARFRANAVNGDVRWQDGANELRTQLIYYDAPLAENPGALTSNELANTPDVADSLNVVRKASKTVDHRMASVSGSRRWTAGSAMATVYGALRELGNPQPFALIDLDRTVLGASLKLQHGIALGARGARFSLGADLQRQRDDRRNHANCAGLTGPARNPATCPTTADQGVLTLDQLERVTSTGAFARAEVELTSAIALTAALRADNAEFSVLDRRANAPIQGEQSRSMSAVSPMAGLLWRVGPLASVYVNVASSFETPTATELANQPDGSGGLNRELDPQRGTSFEVGAKGILSNVLSYDLSVFAVNTDDELIPFEIPGSGGRRFFRNAGTTTRRGGELGLAASLGVWTTGVTYTRLVYEYDDFTLAGTSFAGNRVPGVSPSTATAFVTLRPRRWFATAEWSYAERTPADDANNVYAAAYALTNVRAGFTALSRFGLEPVVGVDNVFDRRYAANVVTNAGRGRFFEPGAGRTFYLGVTARVTN